MLFAAVAGWMNMAASATPLIYGTADIDPEYASTLYSVQASDGAATAIGPIGFYQVGTLAFAPNGSLYGIGKNGANKWVLLKIDLISGAGTAVGATGLDVPFEAITFRSDGILFGYSRRTSAKANGGSVYLIDTGSGAASFVGNTNRASDDCAAVAFSSEKALYAVGQRGLETIGLTNSASKMGLRYSPSFGSTQAQVNAVKFDASSGILWALVQTRGNGNTTYLATIDPKTGNVAQVAHTNVQLNAMALEPRDFGNPAPLPSSLLFLVTGALALAGWNVWARTRRTVRA